MKKQYAAIWNQTKPYLRQAIRKDFVVHVQAAIKGMELLIQKEKADEHILLPAVILHDIGWARVPHKLQKGNNKQDQLKALKQHIKYAPALARKILKKNKYAPKDIKRIIDIIIAHKFQNPVGKEKRLLIDADNMADAFKKPFWSEVKAYHQTPRGLYNVRKKNVFYTKSAKQIFRRELNKRLKEI